MKLYCDPISTTSRPVLLFLADHDLPVELAHVCLLSGEQQGPDFGRVNPNRMVPVLADGDLLLPECSAILKYLADRVGSPAYPAELKARARVNAAMDWFNTGYSFSMNYLHVYPRMFPNHAWDDPATQAATGARGLDWGRRYLDVLDGHMLREAYVCGPDLTLADYLGSSYVGLSEAVGFDLSPWPRVAGWMARMRAHPAWDETYAAFYGMLAAMKTPAAQPPEPALA